MARTELTPASGGELIGRLQMVTSALYNDLKEDSPEGDRAFETRLHNLILMLKRFEAEMKKEY